MSQMLGYYDDESEENSPKIEVQSEWDTEVREFLLKHDDHEILQAIEFYKFESNANSEAKRYQKLLREERDRRGLFYIEDILS